MMTSTGILMRDMESWGKLKIFQVAMVSSSTHINRQRIVTNRFQIEWQQLVEERSQQGLLGQVMTPMRVKEVLINIPEQRPQRW